jgi:sarcosine oxidase, subunit gamma
MAESPLPRTPPELPASPAFEVLGPASRYILRGDAQVAAAASDALGVRVPLQACRAVEGGGRAALWLGPDEWLLLAPAAEAAPLGTALTAALGVLPHSLVDVSHRQVALRPRGPLSATLLAGGCALDLHESSFPVGMCTRTMLGKAEIVLWRTGSSEFRVEVWRSFAAYLCAFLIESARGI